MTAPVTAPRAGDDWLQSVRRERALAGVAAARRPGSRRYVGRGRAAARHQAAERGSVREECTDRLLIFDRGHAEKISTTTPATSTGIDRIRAGTSSRLWTTRTSYPSRQPGSNADKPSQAS
ncbi:hypothetical protein AB0J37_18915 [Microbispora rosea]|uniref:hypothetical protein n=1 Tax=Microbispora rosea TaxID=58117 RepID=UPI00343C5510